MHTIELKLSHHEPVLFKRYNYFHCSRLFYYRLGNVIGFVCEIVTELILQTRNLKFLVVRLNCLHRLCCSDKAVPLVMLSHCALISSKQFLTAIPSETVNVRNCSNHSGSLLKNGC